MRKLRITQAAAAALVLAATLVAATSAAAASSVKIVPFTAAYAGNATVKVNESTNVADIAANGAGKGTIIGAGKVTGLGKGDSSGRPCVPWNGTGTMTGVSGTKLLFTVKGSGCGDEEGKLFSITGYATVTKGLGKLKGAKGRLKTTGTYDNEKGTFAIKFTGKLTLP